MNPITTTMDSSQLYPIPRSIDWTEVIITAVILVTVVTILYFFTNLVKKDA